MNRREFVIATCGAAFGLSARPGTARAETIKPDLAGLVDRNGLKVFNRSAGVLVDGARRGVRLTEAEGDGVAFLPDVELATGTIEIDLRGKDIPQRSFVGVAFHGVDRSTYDGIYFRPFNFRSSDPTSHSHAVQYHSLPVYTWQKLRTEKPGQYEQVVAPVPDPNGWFRARIVIADPKVSVFVGDATQPSLSVTLLSARKKGLVGLWVGNGSGGDFANLTIAPAA